MKIDESLKNNRRIVLASTVFSVGLFSAFALNYYAERFFKSKKSIYENKLGSLFGKKIDLGDYSGLGINGIILSNAKIEDIDEDQSVIESKKLYLGIMPFKSILNRKLAFKIEPYQLNVDINKEFFQRTN